MRQYILGFAIWYWPYLLFGGILFLVLLLCGIALLITSFARRRKQLPAKRHLVSALLIFAVLVCAVAALSLKVQEFWTDVL